MTRRSVRQEASLLLRLVSPEQKAARLSNLAKWHGTQFAEQVAQYADRHPGVR